MKINPAMNIDSKIIENPKRILSGKRVSFGSHDIPLPSVLTIHLTNRCNHGCEWCFFTRDNREVCIENLTSLLSYLDKSSEIKEIVISGGGEPLLHKNIEKLFFELGKYKHIHRRLYTNGHLIPRYLHSIAACFDYVRVSLDAGCSETYARIHKTSESRFEKTLQSMSELIAINKSIRVYASFVVEERNHQESQDFISCAERFGISGVVFKSLVNEVAIRAHTAETLDIKSSSKIDIVVRQEAIHSKVIPPPPVNYSSLNIVYNADGFLYPCCHLTREGDRISKGTIDGIKENYGTLSHMNILKRYSLQPHSCRVHELWSIDNGKVD